MQQQGITKGDALQKLAGISFIIGAVLLLVFNALYPRPDDPTSATQVIQKIASTRGGFWEVDNLLLAVGILGLLFGFAGVYRAIYDGGAAAWARLGYYGIIVGTALFSVNFALQGIGLSLVANQWQAASGAAKDTLAMVAVSEVNVLFGIFSMTVVVFWLSLIFIGIGMAYSKVFPAWSGWLLVALGVLTIVFAGIPQALAGPSQFATGAAFPILAGLSTIYALILGIWIVRKAW